MLNQQRKRFGNTISERAKDLYGRTCLICGFDRCVEYAHVIPAARGGTIHPDNIVPLCPNHHTLYDRQKLSHDEMDIMGDMMVLAWGSQHAAHFPGEQLWLS